jgi:hypothetical protein
LQDGVMTVNVEAYISKLKEVHIESNKKTEAKLSAE